MILIIYLLRTGVGALAGSMLGGKLADVGGNKWKNVPEARMLYGLIASMVLCDQHNFSFILNI